jgi:hypothetical protein
MFGRNILPVMMFIFPSVPKQRVITHERLERQVRQIAEAVSIKIAVNFHVFLIRIELDKAQKLAKGNSFKRCIFIQTCLHVTPFADSQKISQERRRYITESKQDCTKCRG